MTVTQPDVLPDAAAPAQSVPAAQSNESAHKQRLDALQHKVTQLDKRESRCQIVYLVCLALGVVSLILGVGLLIQKGPTDAALCLACFICAGVFCSVVPIAKVRLRFIDGQIQDLEFEKDIVAFSPKKDDTRADKLLRMNQHQLRRYHELNLQQSSWVFAIGFLCILLGIILVGATMYLVRETADGDEKVIVAVLGGVGAILTNFIAAIYLQMHSSATRNLNEFHNTLVATQQLFLANLIASRIEPDDKRWETLAQISLSMIGKK